MTPATSAGDVEVAVTTAAGKATSAQSFTYQLPFAAPAGKMKKQSRTPGSKWAVGTEVNVTLKT